MRMTTLRLMSWVAMAAVFCAIIPAARDITSNQIWVSDKFAGSPVFPKTAFMINPRLIFPIIPALSLLASFKRIPFEMAFTAIISALLAIVSWFFLIRPLGIGPGSLIIWPNDIKYLQYITHLPLPVIFRYSSIIDFFELLFLLGFCFLFLATLLRRPLPYRVRVMGSLTALGFSTGEWIHRMWSGHFQSWAIEIAKLFLLLALTSYITAILISSWSHLYNRTQNTPSSCRPPG